MRTGGGRCRHPHATTADTQALDSTTAAGAITGAIR